MAFVDVRGFYVPLDLFNNTTTASLLDANGEKAGWVFQAPKTGTIDKVGFLTATVTTGDTVDVRLETLDANYDPSGTLWGTNTNKTQVIAATDDNVFFEVTLTAGASVNRGDAIAVVVAMPAAGAVGVINIAKFQGNTKGFPYTDIFNTGAWSKSGQFFPMASIRYSDGTYPYIPGLYPITALSQTAFNSGSSPDERGVKFVAPYTCKVAGAVIAWGGTANNDIAYTLYDVSDNVLATKTKNNIVAAGGGGTTAPQAILFPSEVTLTAGATYRVTAAPQSAGTSPQIFVMNANSSAMATQLPGADWQMVGTSRTNAGAWTDSATNRTQIGLLVSAIDAGSRGLPLAGALH